MESMRRRQNEHLLKILESEQAAEENRERMLRTTHDERERKRLERVFGMERARASEKIMRMTEDHELLLAAKLNELGLAR